MSTIKIKATDVMEDGELKAIEYHDLEGNFQFQALWDPAEEQTEENIAAFREWCDKMATRLDYEIDRA